MFVRGPRFSAAFPERNKPAVTVDLASLASAGFPERLIAAWAVAIPPLNVLQTSAWVGVILSFLRVMGGVGVHFSCCRSKRSLLIRRGTSRRAYGAFGVCTVEASGETDDITPYGRDRRICTRACRFRSRRAGAPERRSRVSAPL